MSRIALSALFTLFAVSAAYAHDCMDKAETQAALNACAQQAYQAADTELNELYQEIRHRLGDDADGQTLLREAERAWITFRDAECTFAASATARGSANAMSHDICLTDLTQNRILTFQKYLQCPEGDLSCPLPPAL